MKNMETPLKVELIKNEQYNTIYDGWILSIHLVDHCNLNCMYCSHFAPLKEKWYITIEDFTKQLKLVKQKLPSLSHLILTGGEPFLHPQLAELISISESIFPAIMISIFSNGLIPKAWGMEKLDKFFQQYSNNIYLGITNYENNLDLLPSRSYIHTPQLNRLFFNQTLIDLAGQQNASSRFQSCFKDNQYHFILKDYKIYYCAFDAYNPLLSSNDCLNLLDDINLNDLYNYSQIPKVMCQYCKKDIPILHTQKYSQTINNYIYSLQELYNFDYDLYLNLVLNINHIKKMQNLQLDENFDQQYLKKYLKSNIIEIDCQKINDKDRIISTINQYNNPDNLCIVIGINNNLFDEIFPLFCNDCIFIKERKDINLYV